MAFAILPLAASHEFLEWVGEVLREIGIDRQHIAEFGFPALILAVVLGTIVWGIRSS